MYIMRGDYKFIFTEPKAKLILELLRHDDNNKCNSVKYLVYIPIQLLLTAKIFGEAANT